MNQLDTFDQYRSLLFAIAYRMLGSVMDAEDMEFGTLRVFNDDTLSPGAIWPLHPHREIEAGYLSNTDLDNAREVLAHVPITNSAAQNKKAVALADEAYQHKMIRQAAELIADDEVISAYEDEELQLKTIEAAEGQLAADEIDLAAAEATIASAYHDVAAALVVAGLMDAANIDAVVGVIKKEG